MPKRPFEPKKSSTELALAQSSKTEKKQSQIELTHLPDEILAKILGYLPASDIGKARHVSTRFNQVITAQYHGPRSRDFNNYLNLFTNNKKNTALTYYDYYEKIKRHKEPFLEKQFLEIQTIQKNLINHSGWRHVSRELKEEIFQIKEKNIHYAEANRREALLDDIHTEVIKPKINLQSQYLRVAYLNLTRLPKALFTDNELQAFWQTLEILALDNNQLTTLPAEITRLQTLTDLYLDNNQLITVPTEISRLRTLEVLALHDNQLTTLPAELGELTALVALSLSNNRLTTLLIEISSFQALEILSLSDNLLTSLPVEIGGLPMLRRLSLRNNQLSSETLRQFEQRLGVNFVQKTLETQTYPNIAETEEASNRNSPRP